jgi:hypothetical protein
VTIDPDAARGRVAVILAVAAGLGVLLITAAALIDAALDPESRGVSPAYASILTTTLGTIVGGLVGYVGGTVTRPRETPDTPDDPPRA